MLYTKNLTIRQKTVLESIIIIIFFVSISYLYLGVNIFSGKIVAPMDLLLSYPGWKESGISTTIVNIERSDILDGLLPVWINTRNTILGGELPLWSLTRSGGSPSFIFLGNSFISVSFLLFLIFGGGIGFTLGLLAKLVIAGFGTYKLCRTQLGILPSIFGGIVYMMCGFNAGWLMWPHVSTGMWIPWLLWAIIKLETASTRKWIIVVALFTTALIFGGFMSVSAYGLMLTGLLIIWMIIIRVRHKDDNILKRNLFIISGIILGILLASVQIIPFIEWLGQFDTSFRHGGSLLQINNMDTLWEPFRYSYNLNGNVIPKVEMNGYIGKIPILFSIIALLYILTIKKRHFTPISPLFWIPVTILTIMVAFNFSPITQFVYELPVFNNNASNRLLVLIGLEFAVISSFGFQELLETLKSQNLVQIKNLDIIILILATMIITIQIVDMTRIGQSQNAVVPRETFYPDTPTIDYITNNIVHGQSVIASGDTYMISGTINAYGISEWYAHGYFRSSEKELLERVVNNAWKTPTAALFNSDQIKLNSSATDDITDALGIRYVLTSRKINHTDNWKSFKVGDIVTIYENKDVPPGAYIVKGELDKIDRTNWDWNNIKIINFNSNTQTYMIDTNYSGWFVKTARTWPGWNTYVNGKLVKTEKYLDILPAVPIEPGISIIKFEYKPLSFFIGTIISFVTLLFLLFMVRK